MLVWKSSIWLLGVISSILVSFPTYKMEELPPEKVCFFPGMLSFVVLLALSKLTLHFPCLSPTPRGRNWGWRQSGSCPQPPAFMSTLPTLHPTPLLSPQGAVFLLHQGWEHRSRRGRAEATIWPEAVGFGEQPRENHRGSEVGELLSDRLLGLHGCLQANQGSKSPPAKT